MGNHTIKKLETQITQLKNKIKEKDAELKALRQQNEILNSKIGATPVVDGSHG